MDSSIVIKVKCCDTLRRFNANLSQNEKLELTMEQLRAKIRGLFNLSADAEFTLTYTDGDGDTVTLVEDCDLDDVVLQRLNPVRIHVTLKEAESSALAYSRSGDRFSPREFTGFQQSIQSIQASVAEALKYVPEPLLGVLSKLNCDLSLAASTPVVAEIIQSASKSGESASKIGESLTRQVPQSDACKESSAEKKNGEGERNTGLSGSKSKSNVVLKDKRVEAGICPVPDLNYAPLPAFSGVAATTTTASNEQNCGSNYNPFNVCPFAGTQVGAGYRTKGDRNRHLDRSHGNFNSAGTVFHAGVQCDICGVHPITGPRFKSKVRYNYDLCDSCFQKSGSEADYVRIDSPLLYRNIMKAFHRKHGAHGPRFHPHGPFNPIPNSYEPFLFKPESLGNQVKLDSFFISDVNVMDGTLMAPSTHFTKIWRMRNTGNTAWPRGTQLVWTDGDKFSKTLFVDLEIPAVGVCVDGEIDVAVDFIAPEQPGQYASYWRMSSPSGQKFGTEVWVIIQVDASPDPLSGSFSQLNLNLPPQGNGINDPIVIDINVEPSVGISYNPSRSSPGVTLVKADPDSTKIVNQESKTVTVPRPVAELVAESVVGEQLPVSNGLPSTTVEMSKKDHDLNFPINDTLLVGNVFPTALPVVSSVSYPVVDSSKVEAMTSPVNSSSNMENGLVPSSQTDAYDETEESLLKELSVMGFKQVDLNREILRVNNYDMEQALVDLCEISEWDPILDELEEMGFSDKKKNAKLLVKNKGSIKRVVMDLIAAEKAQ